MTMENPKSSIETITNEIKMTEIIENRKLITPIVECIILLMKQNIPFSRRTKNNVNYKSGQIQNELITTIGDLILKKY